MNFRTSYIGCISIPDDVDDSIVKEVLKLTDIKPSLIRTNIIEVFLYPLKVMGMVKQTDNIFIASKDMLREDLDSIDMKPIIDMVTELNQLIILPGFLTLAERIVLDGEALLRNPNKASVLIHYLKGVVSFISRYGVERIVIVESALNDIAQGYQLAFGYRREYILEAYDYIAYNTPILIAIYLPKKLSSIAFELIAMTPNVSAIGFDASSIPSNLEIFTPYILELLRTNDKSLVIGIVDVEKECNVYSIIRKLAKLVRTYERIDIVTLDTGYGKTYERCITIDTLKRKLETLKHAVENIKALHRMYE